MADYADLIGTPFKYGGRENSGALDCYGFIMQMLRRDGIEIPDYESPSDGASITAIFVGELRLWEKISTRPGAVHLFRVPGNLHVGYAIDQDRFVHTWEKTGGVTVERLSENNWKQRLIGTYKYVGK